MEDEEGGRAANMAVFTFAVVIVAILVGAFLIYTGTLTKARDIDISAPVQGR